jgi:hypothetical protein
MLEELGSQNNTLLQGTTRLLRIIFGNAADLASKRGKKMMHVPLSAYVVSSRMADIEHKGLPKIGYS